MDQQVIHIYGASGSGTSTIGRFICDKLGYFFMDTDDYFWELTNPPYTTKRNISDRIAMMRKDISEHDHVVISGSLAGWGDALISLFTLAIRINTPTATRISRVKKRDHERFGSRIDRGGDMYENHCKFIDWAASYDHGGIGMRSKLNHDEWQKQLQCPIIHLDGNLPLEKNFELLKNILSE